MTILDNSICWAVLAPLPVAELEAVAAKRWKQQVPYAIDPSPWETLAGDGEYNALVSRSPGTEGADRPLAEQLSKRVPRGTVFSLWLDPERSAVFEWKKGRETSSDERTVEEVAEETGFTVAEIDTGRSCKASVAVVEGASLAEIRRVLGDALNEGTQVREVAGGVLVSHSEGSLGLEPWDVATALPSATVYYVQQWPDSFIVHVMQGQADSGIYEEPFIDGPRAAHEIKGVRGREAILNVLGVPGESLRLK